jgi:hypothetical protein
VSVVPAPPDLQTYAVPGADYRLAEGYVSAARGAGEPGSAIESGPSSPLRAPHGQNQIIATIQGALNRIGRNQIHQGSLVAIG